MKTRVQIRSDMKVLVADGSARELPRGATMPLQNARITISPDLGKAVITGTIELESESALATLFAAIER